MKFILEHAYKKMGRMPKIGYKHEIEAQTQKRAKLGT